MQLVVRLVNASDERVDEFVSSAKREPLDEKLIDLIFSNLETNVSSELACTQLVYHSLFCAL